MQKLYLEVIMGLIREHPKAVGQIIQYKYPEILKFLEDRYPMLSGHKISEYCYWFINDLTEFPTCERLDKKGCMCSNKTKFKGFKHGYDHYCSRLCMQQSVVMLEKRKVTNKSKFGCDWPGQSKQVQEKAAETKQHHKDEDPDYDAKIKQKINATYKKRLDQNENYWKEVEEKCKATKVLNGMDPNWNNREKFRETLFNFTPEQRQHRHVKQLESISQHLAEDKNYWNNVNQKRKQTNVKNGHPANWHNVEQMLDTKEIRYGDGYYRNTEQAKRTCLELYGVESYSQTLEFARCHAKHIYSETYDLTFDSQLELDVYDFCIKHGLTIVYQPQSNLFYDFMGKRYKYQPDFLIHGKLYEVKGDHFFRQDGTMYCPFKNSQWSDAQYMTVCARYEAKHQCMIANNVIILKKKEIKNLLDVFKDYL